MQQKVVRFVQQERAFGKTDQDNQTIHNNNNQSGLDNQQSPEQASCSPHPPEVPAHSPEVAGAALTCCGPADSCIERATPKSVFGGNAQKN